MKNLKKTLSLILLLVASASVYAQKASPAAKATGKIGEATITISYSSPAVKERKIWGELVPYNKIWRAGANEATIFETDKALKSKSKNYQQVSIVCICYQLKTNGLLFLIHK
ncbi:MAG: DUF2911 domain-containing protein [Pedobacter sp.]|jgi:hypothetical protein